MSEIISKPCFAFDALAAIALREVHIDGVRNDIPYVKNQIEKNFKGIKIGGSDSYFRLFTDQYSLHEIEKMDLKEFADIYPDCIKGNKFEEQFLKSLQILKDMDFTHLWEQHCLPFLNKQCNEYNSLLQSENKMVSGILSDIQYIKPDEKIDDINIYMTYFTRPVHMAIGSNSYITNHGENHEINIKSMLRMFAHELTHGFANQKIREIYEKTRDSDELLKKCKSIMYRNGATGDEEEFVCALDNYISFKNGLMTKEEVYNKGDGSRPIVLIVVDELMKLGRLPENINSWIYDLFINGIIEVGEIESKVNKIIPGYVDNFMNIYFKDEK